MAFQEMQGNGDDPFRLMKFWAGSKRIRQTFRERAGHFLSPPIFKKQNRLSQGPVIESGAPTKANLPPTAATVETAGAPLRERGPAKATGKPFPPREGVLTGFAQGQPIFRKVVAAHGASAGKKQRAGRPQQSSFPGQNWITNWLFNSTVMEPSSDRARFTNIPSLPPKESRKFFEISHSPVASAE